MKYFTNKTSIFSYVSGCVFKAQNPEIIPRFNDIKNELYSTKQRQIKLSKYLNIYKKQILIPNREIKRYCRSWKHDSSPEYFLCCDLYSNSIRNKKKYDFGDVNNDF